MKTKLIYFTILLFLLATFICMFWRSTPSSQLASEDHTEFFLGSGMPPDLMTRQRLSTSESHDLMKHILTTMGVEWTTTGSPKHHVRKNDLIEVDESEGVYVLSMQLFREDQHLATEHRFFVSYPGPDGEIADRPVTYLACAMLSNGFLSGSCELTEKSSTEVSIAPNWTFDDRDANVKSRFDQSFIATIGDTGTAECSNGALIKWVFDHKVTERK